MKKKIFALCGVLIVAAVAFGVWYQFFRTPADADVSAENPVAVERVAVLTGSGIGGDVQNRYSGVVESQETLDVKKDDTKTVKNILVTEGQVVEVGTPLFEYDTAELTLKLEQAQIDLERIAADIETANRQINELTAEKNKAKASEQLEYTIQIQAQQTSIKESEYSQKSKLLEIEQLQESITNNVVTSTIGGRIQEINEMPAYDNMGNPKPFIQILTIGDYRIKGTVNEQNIWNLSEGQPVIVRSRVDESQTWPGTITKIDTENPVSNQNSYYSSSDSGNQSNSYPFYVELDENVPLMMGQHLLIETDLGQTEAREGLWLYDYYIVQGDGMPYVWIANEKDRLEKRPVTLGEYDENLMQYQILDGLSETDSIAWPEDTLTEGTPIVRPGSESFDNSGMDDMKK
ncbi:MAG: efflux RND transporter periplasmic adaptor subunit [Lachnospiraceae bacterium]|nr:efflux RND transporter periplasmic adaptor subunit [Lachnospiraceae bacterium]